MPSVSFPTTPEELEALPRVASEGRKVLRTIVPVSFGFELHGDQTCRQMLILAMSASDRACACFARAREALATRRDEDAFVGYLTA